MAQILSQDEINQLLAAIGSGDESESFEKIKLSQKENEALLKYFSQKEIDNLLEKLNGDTSNTGKYLKSAEEYKSDGELSEEEINALLNSTDSTDNDKK